jgi:hypothetical protein
MIVGSGSGWGIGTWIADDLATKNPSASMISIERIAVLIDNLHLASQTFFALLRI